MINVFDQVLPPLQKQQNGESLDVRGCLSMDACSVKGLGKSEVRVIENINL